MKALGSLPRCASANLQSSIFNLQSLRPAAAGLRGFTLLELLCVLGLIVFLLSVALGSSLGWGRASGLRASVLEVKSSLTLTRQLAVTHGTRASVFYGNFTTPVPSGHYVVSTNDGSAIIGETNYLPKGFVFATNDAGSVAFQPDGTSTGDTDIVVREVRGANFLAATVTVGRATGFIRTSE